MSSSVRTAARIPPNAGSGARREIATTLERVVARSQTLGERVRRPARTTPDAPADTAHTLDAAALLSAWCELAASGSWTSFEKRLAWDGLSAQTVTSIVERSHPAPIDKDLAGWAETLRDAYAPDAFGHSAADAGAEDAADRASRADAPLPFEELLLPLVAHARERVRIRAGSAYDLAAASAHAQLERALLQRLSRVGMRALYAEYTVFRSLRQQSGNFALFPVAAGQPTGLYASFIEMMQRGGLTRFLEQYSVAARLLGTVTDLWADATTEFLLRLATDLPELEVIFGDGAPLGVVDAIRADLSDPHLGGRSVFTVRWTQGVSIVYKPRPIGLERRYGDFLRWLQEDTDHVELRSLHVVCRPTHGWIEFAAYAPCDDRAQVERYYRRSGALLCVAYALNASDFHYENLIACGEYPVLIDMETLLGPSFLIAENQPASAGAGGGASRHCAESVLSVRMLPDITVRDDGRVYNLGGLGGIAEAGEPAEIPRWKHVNTDAMKLEFVRVSPAPRVTNLPALNGSTVAAGEFVDQIIAGFTATYQSLLARQQELLAPDSMLAAMRGERIRVILRNTSLYATILERCLQPRYLRNGVERSIQLDALARPLLAFQSKPAIWRALESEHDALDQMDVPIFLADADSASLVLPSGEMIDDCFDATAYEQAVRRVERLSAHDLAFQTELIHAAFRANAGCDLRATVAAPVLRRECAYADAEWSRARAIARATAVAERLRARALGDGQGGREASWIGTEYLPRARRYRVGPLSPNLLDGYAGIALFLAGLSRVTGAPEWRNLALDTLAPFRARLDEYESVVRLRRLVDVGAASGLGSTVYALARCGRLLDEPALVDVAGRVARLITPEVVARSDVFDVVSGSAGAILGLLALHDATTDESVLARAAQLGAGLLERVSHDEATGYGVWLTRRGRAELGFAHGQAGIAYALQRLSQFTGGASLRNAAASAVMYEQHMIASEESGVSEDDAAAAWSHGTTGIALARLGGLAIHDTPAIRAEIEQALQRAMLARPGEIDTLCCGNAARVELLLAAARTLARPELALSAQAICGRLVADADDRGAFETGWGAAHPSIGLFYGTSGIAYTLLRVAEPDAIPCPLLWL